MRIFITGAAGQLGHELSGLLRGSELLLGQRPEYDITDERIVERICDFHPNIVIHAAAYTDVDGCEKNRALAHQVNAVGTYHVAAGAEKCRAKLVYLSTDYVFKGEKDTPYVETDDPAPLNIYGQSKWEGEQFVRQSCSRHIILRTSWVYGSAGRNFVKTILEKASQAVDPSGEAGGDLRVVHDQVGCPTYAKDLAQAISAIIELEAYGIYHAAGQGSCSWYEFSLEILRLAGLRKKVVPIDTSEMPRPARRPRHSVLCREKLNGLGIYLRPWQEALGEFIRTRNT